MSHYNFAEGTEVGVIKHSTRSWGPTHLQGLYVVTKCNGAVLQLSRLSDGYCRTFSNRTGCEKHSYGTDSRYDTALVVSADNYNSCRAQQEAAAELGNLWYDAEKAVKSKDITALREILTKIDTFSTAAG